MEQHAAFLMVAPDHYRVNYVINPWMEEGRRRHDFPGAQDQWNSLYEVLSSLPGVSIEVLESHSELPDMVFTANAGLVIHQTFIPSRFRFPQRSGEEACFRRWASDTGFTIRDLPAGAFFEGAGDALFDRAQPVLWIGHGYRTNVSALDPLSEIAESSKYTVFPLQLKDPRFYHLDTCFCPLTGGNVLYYPEAFTNESLIRLESVIPEDSRIPVSRSDAYAFACNAVNVGRAIVLNDASETLVQQLAERNYAVIRSPLDEFMLSGGAAKCLTLRIDEPVPIASKDHDGSGSESTASISL